MVRHQSTSHVIGKIAGKRDFRRAVFHASGLARRTSTINAAVLMVQFPRTLPKAAIGRHITLQS